MLSLRHEPMDDFFQVHNTTDYGMLFYFLYILFSHSYKLASTESQSFISLPHLTNYTSEEAKSTRTVREYLLFMYQYTNCLIIGRYYY